MPDIEFTEARPDMLVHPYVLELPPLPSGMSLPDQIRANASEPDGFARMVRALDQAAKVERLERALAQLAADAEEEASLAERKARGGNVVPFPGRGR